MVETWMTPIIRFLVDGSFLENREKAKSLQQRAAQYVYDQGQLFKKGFSMPLLTCITLEEGVNVFKEIHKGICDNYSRPRVQCQKFCVRDTIGRQW